MNEKLKETICGCGHPTSTHGLYGCHCGCTESVETLRDMDELSNEIIVLTKVLLMAKDAMKSAMKLYGFHSDLNHAIFEIDKLELE